ncbi:ribonuclease H-like domain-containing protein [Tanacetum coccineum]
MEPYLAHQNYPIWEDLLKRGNGPWVSQTDTNVLIKVQPLQEDCKRNVSLERAKKQDLDGNDESKTMLNYYLKQHFEGFFVSNSEGLHKGYDRFQSLLSQLEIHGAGVSTEDANQKFLTRCIFAKSGRSKGNQDNRRRDAWNTRIKDKENRRRSGKKEDSKALVTLDGEGVDWTSHSEDKQENYALMAYSSSGSDTEVTSCLKEYEESYAKLKKLYDEQREQLGDASIEIQAYTQALKKVKLNYQMMLWIGLDLDKDIEESLVNDKIAEGMHCSTRLYMNEGIYIPSGPDKEIDDSQFTYGPKQSKPSESDARSSDFNTCESNYSEDEHLSLPHKNQKQPSFAFINTVTHVKIPRQTVKEQNTCSQSPKPDKKDCSGLMAENLGLGYGFTKKACFVCGSFSHLIRDCDFHEKRMAKHAELNNKMSKGSGQRKIRPAVPTNAARKVNTVKPIVNNARPKAVLLGGKGKLLLSPQQVVIRDTKDITGTKSPNTMVDQVLEIDYPQRALKNKEIVDSRCSRHMTGNKAYLAEYQDFNGGLVAFEGSKGYISGKGKIKTGKLDFEDVCFVKELQHFNLFFVSQMCDKKNKNIVPSGGLACLVAKATIDESNKWHRRLGHVNFKNLNKLVKGNLGCPCDHLLNTIDHLRKLMGKSNEGYFSRYFTEQSKAFRVYNLETKRVEENMHITFLENKPNVAGNGPTWLFDLDYLTDSMNYQPVRSENQANKHAGPKEVTHSVGTKDNIDAENSEIEAESAQDYFVLPIWSSYTSTVKSSKAKNAGKEPNKNPDLKTDEKPVDKEDQVFFDELERLKRQEQDANDVAEALRKEFAKDTEDLLLQAGAAKASSTNTINTASTPVSTASPYGGLSFTDTDQDDSEIPALEDMYDPTLPN